MAINNINVGQELLNVPMGEMIRSMAMAIADAQWALDKSSMTVAELMSGQRMVRDLETGELSTDADGNPRVVDSRVHFGYTYNLEDGKVKREANKVSMMELGFTPNFYQFVDTIIEVRIAISMKGETQQISSSQTKSDARDESASASQSAYGTGNWWWWGHSSGSDRRSRTTASTSQVNASYANKYSYSVEGSSLLRTKLVPIPPPAILEERISELMTLERAYIDYLKATALLESRKAQMTPEEFAESKALIDERFAYGTRPPRGEG
ncbi:MAG: hypothetical protein KC486_05265 [Myxococcales bacterium]|nr:hypothetical protein [Myxococcales bacterium]